jgi:hypothetical protein
MLLLSGADASVTIDGADAASIALSGPRPASAERHAIADLLHSLGGAAGREQRDAEVISDDQNDDFQEL